jgi:hypothetical protein
VNHQVPAVASGFFSKLLVWKEGAEPAGVNRRATDLPIVPGQEIGRQQAGAVPRRLIANHETICALNAFRAS